MATIPTPGGVTVRTLGVPGSFMVAEHFQRGFFTRNIDQDQVVDIIANQDCVFRVRMVVIAVIGHIDTLDHFSVFISQTNEWNKVTLFFNSHLSSDSLSTVRCDRAIVTRTAVVKKDQSILSSEFMANGVFVLAKDRSDFP